MSRWPEKTKEVLALRTLRLVQGHAWAAYRYRARQYNRRWDLTRDQFVTLITSVCVYCGAKPQLRALRIRGSWYSSYLNGVDRIDSTQGYAVENTVSCCTQCNRWKSNLSPAEFLAHSLKIVTYTQRVGAQDYGEHRSG